MNASHLIQRNTGRAYPYTDGLMERGDMVPARYDSVKKKYVPLVDFGGPDDDISVPVERPAPPVPVSREVSAEAAAPPLSIDNLVDRVAERLLPTMKALVESLLNEKFPDPSFTIQTEPRSDIPDLPDPPPPITQAWEAENIPDDHDMMALKTKEIIDMAKLMFGVDLGPQRTKKHAIAAYLTAESEKGAK